MPEFILETSGNVAATEWCDLDSFTQGYIEALFFTDEEQLCEESDGEREMPSIAVSLSDAGKFESQFVGGNSYGFSDLASDTLETIIADCAKFQQANADLLAQAYAREYDESAAGRDFWYTRNGHGVGFWDRDALEPDSEEYESLTAEMVAASKSGDNAAWNAALNKRNAIKTESLGERLSTAARACGEVWSYVGDDGKVHLS